LSDARPCDMNPARKPLVLRIVVVTFAISLLAGYVVFSQTRAKPRATNAPSTKSGPVLQTRQSSGPRSDLTDTQIITSSNINGPIFSSRKTSDVNVSSAEPAVDTRSTLDLADSWLDGETVTVMSSTKSAPVFRPIRFPYDWWTLHLRWFKPRPEPEPLNTETDTVSGSRGLVDLVPKDAALEPLDPRAIPLSSPGSKSLVPLISEDWADSLRRKVFERNEAEPK
jgi:hypothetical protein